MARHLRGFVVLALLVVFYANASATTSVLKGGRALLPVVVAVDASPEERDAAVELVRVLGAMSGSDWPMHTEDGAQGKGFYVGRTLAAARLREPLKPGDDLLLPKSGEIGPDGFRICTHDGSVFIEGATPEATGYAVAWLLQHEAGVRWYAPGKIGEVIPARTEWTLPDLDLVREPGYVSREMWGFESPDGCAWALHNGLLGRLEYSHALGGVFSRETLAANPEWCPLLKGGRYQPVSAEDFRWQPNLALPEVAEHAAQVATAAFASDPRRPSYSLGINDTVRFDQSEATRKLVEPLHYFRGKPDFSPLVFSFMNRAAETTGRTNPGRYLGCLAYFWCENTPPFPVNAQVIPYLTTDRSQYYDSAYRKADFDLMARWGASGVRAFGLWEYGEGSNFLVPRVPCRAFAEAVREGWRRGARGYMVEVGPRQGFDEFKVWLLAQLLWEPERPFEELADDFFRGYYGPAAKPMREFFDRCEKRWMTQDGPPSWLKYYQQEDQALLFPPEVCHELRAVLDTASRAARNNRVISERIAQTSRAFAVTETFVAFYAVRQKLSAIANNEIDLNLEKEKKWAALIREFCEQRTRLEKAYAAATSGKTPAMARTELSYFVRNDPVPRLLWLMSRQDPQAALGLLKQTGPDALQQESWRKLAEAFADENVFVAKELVPNGAFGEAALQMQEPRFLYPRSGTLPARWEVKAMPTETGMVTLIESTEEGRSRRLRIEGAWDTQVYQWLPAKPGQLYVTTAQLRGRSSSGNDSALFLTFLSADGKVVGAHRMQSLPKGTTSDWWTSALADIAPADTAWVGVGFGASRQVTGDWLEAGSISLRELNGVGAP